METTLFFTSKDSFKSFVKKQVKTNFYLAVATQIQSLSYDRHSSVQITKKHLINWVDSNLYEQYDGIKVNISHPSMPHLKSFAFCYVTDQEYIRKLTSKQGDNNESK